VIPKTITIDFNFQGAPQLSGELVSVYGYGLIYNVPGYNASTDPFPYVSSACALPNSNNIRLSGFGSAGPVNNSTEIFVSNWYDAVISAQLAE
jgi:hypothetical protein